MPDPRLSFVTGVTSVQGAEALATLGSTVIRIVVGPATQASYAGQVLAFQVATLCARLFDHVVVEGDIVATTESKLTLLTGPFLDTLNQHLSTILPGPTQPQASTVVVGVGDVESPADIYLGCTGWSASVSFETPQPMHAEHNPVGALGSGTLGASEVFKLVFQAQLRGSVRRPFKLSLLTYETRQNPLAEPEIGEMLDVDATLFGCGSIGFGFLQALLLGPTCSGRLNLVDNGSFDSKNVTKYALIDQQTATRGGDKSAWAGEFIRRFKPGLEATAFIGTAQEFVASLPADYSLPLALAAVDTVEGRVEIQDTLPKLVINAGITGTTAEVSAHRFDEGACLACIGLDTALESWDPYPIATATGLPPVRVLELIRENGRMTQTDIDLIKATGQLSNLGELDAYLDQPILSLWNRVLYSEASLQVAGAEVRVTTAFVSAFAGLLLYAELVKHTQGASLQPFQVSNSYRQDLIGVPLGEQFTYPRDSRGWCICHSSFRQMIYRQKYSEDANRSARSIEGTDNLF